VWKVKAKARNDMFRIKLPGTQLGTDLITERGNTARSLGEALTRVTTKIHIIADIVKYVQPKIRTST